MEERLNIFLSQGMISEETGVYIREVLRNYVERYNFPKDSSELLITHLAMATSRVLKNDIAAKLDDIVLDQLREFEHHELVEYLTNKILEDNPANFPEEEQQYMWIHLTNILNALGDNIEVIKSDYDKSSL